jgi:hypothetical protein
MHSEVKWIPDVDNVQRCFGEQTAPHTSEDNRTGPDTRRYSRDRVWIFSEARTDMLSSKPSSQTSIIRVKHNNLGPKNKVIFHHISSSNP